MSAFITYKLVKLAIMGVIAFIIGAVIQFNLTKPPEE